VHSGLERYGTVLAPRLPSDGFDAVIAATAELPAPAILVGHSMAGIVALRRAALDPGSVTGVVLADSFFPPARNGRTRTAALADYGSHRVAVARELWRRGARPRPRRSTGRGMRGLAALALRPGALHAAADRVRAPVLVVHARHDHHVPVDFAIAAAARHSSWRLELVEHGGHNVHLEQPAEWLAAVTPWIEGVTGG
jgi:pimeloyl-ACP methyl ester carboxylesterase